MREVDTDNVTTPLARLGEFVTARCEELGLTQAKAAQRAGVDRMTWIGVEHGTRRARAHTYANVERVLGWGRGSIADIFAGGQPTVADEAISTAPTEFGIFLREAMTAARLRVPDLAGVLGVRSAAINDWMYGRAVPTVAEWRALFQRLQLAPSHSAVARLAGKLGPDSPLDPEQQRALERLVDAALRPYEQPATRKTA